MKNMDNAKDQGITSVAKFPIEKLKQDCDLMLDYAIKRGIPLPKEIIIDNSGLDNDEMVTNYNDLVKVILAATVESITYINNNVFNKNIIIDNEIIITKKNIKQLEGIIKRIKNETK